MIEAHLIVQVSHHRISRTVTAEEKSQAITLVLDYLSEGGANVVYRIIILAAGACRTVPSEVKGTLLRVRKDKAFITGTQQQQKIFTKTFADLFPAENLIEQILISVDTDVLKAVNDDLRSLEIGGYRSKLRYGDLVAIDEPFGLLVTDMTAHGADVLLEVKPKWLLQSPDAPDGALRCRTCALRARRRVAKGKGEMVPTGAGFCPLAFIDGDDRAREEAAEAIIRANGALLGPAGPRDLAHVLAHSVGDLLQTLRTLQSRFDPNGILALDPHNEPSEDFLKAMTLRDCTIFIKAKDGILDSTVQVRLADLDLKQSHPDKVHKWKQTERSLVDEGWYTCTETDTAAEHICLLSKTEQSQEVQKH